MLGCLLWFDGARISSVAAADPQQKPLKTILREADAVLGAAKTDFVSAAKDWKIVALAGERLHQEHRYDDAISCLEQAVQLAPHEVEVQMELAETCRDAGKGEKAAAAAKIVWENAETQSMLENSAALLGVKMEALPPVISSKATNDPTIGVAIIGQVDPWIVAATARILHNSIGLPIQRLVVRWTPEAPTRTAARIVAKNIRDTIRWDVPAVQDYAAEIGITDKDKASDMKLAELLTGLLLQSGDRARAVQVMKDFEQAGKEGFQWEDQVLWAPYLAATQPYLGHFVTWMGITSMDIFSGKSNYVFANGRSSISEQWSLVSYARFQSSFWHQTPNRKRFETRLKKQLLSSFANAKGLPRCSNPSCVRAYPASLDDLDAKGEEYCPQCRKALEDMLGFKLPTAKQE